MRILAAPVQRSSLHEIIVTQLREMILDGRLAPGTSVPELDLCRDLDISRTPLREALKVLAAEELVRLLPNRGAVVSEIVPEEIAEIFEVVEGLERLIGHLVVERASEADVAEIRGLYERLVGLKESGDKHAYFDLNQATHRRLAEMTRNRVLTAGYAGYSDKIRRARWLANLSATRWSESVREHAAFTEALERRDGEALSRLLAEHAHHTGVAVIAALRALPAAETTARRRRRS
ncbi:MAG: GntR family transcriptional regulator [Phyllobacteriaceae bacterium]|nr:GntR family transcriptional regulator [Phyllobacteriaceae bacterium]